MFGSFKKANRQQLIQEYQTLCLRHGNTSTQIRRLQKENKEVEARLDSINKQFEKVSAAQQAEHQRKAKAAPKAPVAAAPTPAQAEEKAAS